MPVDYLQERVTLEVKIITLDMFYYSTMNENACFTTLNENIMF